jgi:hypothetical protein
VVDQAVTDSQPPDDDGAADTQMFRAFVEREESAPVTPKGPAFQIITLLVGLVVLAGVIYLLLKL